MANNFRLQANKYVSKAGQPGNLGGSPDAPALYLDGNEDSFLTVLGTGVYNWPTQFIYNRQGFNNLVLRADGRAVLLGDGQTRFQWMTAGGCLFEGLRFEQFAGFQFAHSDSNPPVYRRCEFEVLPAFASSPNSGVSGRGTFEDCVFRNVHFSNGSTPGLFYGQGGALEGATFTRCLFFGCTFTSAAQNLTQCYFDPFTVGWGSTQPQYGTGWPTAATGNNVDPAADLGQGYGLRLDTSPVAHLWPQNYSAEPQFNAVANSDFSVQAGSPHLTHDIGPRQYRQASTYLVQGPAAGQPVGTANTTFVAQHTGAQVGVLEPTTAFTTAADGALVLDPQAAPSGLASLHTDVVRHSAGLPREISYMQVLSGANFNTDYPSTTQAPNPAMPEVFNNNVPDLGTDTPGGAGRNPNRLSYRLRWSTLPTPPDPANPGHWATGSTWVECEWNARPLYNPLTLIGNGRAEFDPGAARPVICSWYQLEVGLSNVYSH